MKIKNLLILILMTSLIILIAKLYNTERTYSILQTTSTDNSNDSSLELSVWIDDNLCLSWWKNEADNTYCIFIPGTLRSQKLCLTFKGTSHIFIDGEKLTYGSKYNFTQGQHSLRYGENDNSIYSLSVWYTSNIPTLFLETQSGSTNNIHSSKDLYETGRMMIMDSSGRKYYEGIIDDIHCRGNSSFENTDKKSYSIKLAHKVDLFNMGEAKKWILTANAFDDTLVRNATVFSIAKILGLAYTPDSRYVDVYINGCFEGNYLLSEKIEVGRNRVNIKNLENEVQMLNNETGLENMDFFMEPQGRLFSTKGYYIDKEPSDISGGYLLELETSDRYGLEASGFLTSRMQPVVFASPKYASYNQVSYVATLYQDFEDAVFSSDGHSPYTGKAYYEYIDTDSFARKYLIEELTKNLDASFTSQYIYKYDNSVGSKFYAGPCWDYDKSIAASGITEDGINLNEPTGLYAAVREKDSDIWYALYQHEDFKKEAAAIFFNELEPMLREGASEIIYHYSSHISESNDCNMIRWNTFPQAQDIEEKRTLHDAKTSELVRFIDNRLDFMENEWGYLKDE